MGRGDIKTKKGKIFSGSFGKTRPSKLVKKAVAPRKPAPAAVAEPVVEPVAEPVVAKKKAVKKPSKPKE
jgi:30S ribosomal protein S31